ncbi:MAG TPA: response regulator [Burkholderiales bacterium]|nr:response regulator [Burkholderiales bacterium]
MRILIAEDVEDTRYLMKTLLEMKGHCVTEACNGREAVERAVVDHPDLILMDVTMPVMDGLSATRNIKANPETSLIPVVAISALMGDPTWRGRALASGCSDCYAKPLDFEALDGLLATAH